MYSGVHDTVGGIVLHSSLRPWLDPGDKHHRTSLEPCSRVSLRLYAITDGVLLYSVLVFLVAFGVTHGIVSGLLLLMYLAIGLSAVGFTEAMRSHDRLSPSHQL